MVVNVKMAAEFAQHNKPNFSELPTLKGCTVNQPTDVINMLKRDRFELLSAYLDGEVTAAERRQVEDWLANEPEVQRLYARLLKLRQELRALPVPPVEQSVEQTIQHVFRRINRRVHLTVIFGGTAIAALFIGAVSGTLSDRQFAEIAQSPKLMVAPGETLMVALNTPVVEIPKAAVAAPENAIMQIEYPAQQSKDKVN